MPERTVKGAAFTIVVDDKRILIEHIFGKGKRCRVSAPPGVVIEPAIQSANNGNRQAEPAVLERLRESLKDEDELG